MERETKKGGRKKMPEELTSVLNKKRSIGFYLYSNWIFSSLIEKVGLMIMIGLGTWKIIDFFI